MISLNGVMIKATIFPDKTSQVWQLPEKLLQDVYKEPVCTVRWEFESEAEFLHLAQLKTLLDTYNVYVNLEMPYLPYGRQDKRIDNNSTFALYTFAKLLNTLNFNNVEVLDAHNNLRANMISRLTDKTPRDHITKAFDTVKADYLLFPDAGAKLRYDAYGIADSIYADKVRNQSNGKIMSITIHGDVKDQKLLIVDDICDGGATFRMIAEEAIKRGATEVHLYVTHGIFSQGLEVLEKSGIKRIFTHKGEVTGLSNAALKAELVR